jgi:hypothetical protein
MKKVLNFLVNTRIGKKSLFAMTVGMFGALLIGIFLLIPSFWMSGREYNTTWMNNASAYFLAPFLLYSFFTCAFFAPYLEYIARSPELSGSGNRATRRIMIGTAHVLALVPGGMLYRFFAESLSIPPGLHNLVGLVGFGAIYLQVIQLVLKKPFSIAKEFVPLT